MEKLNNNEIESLINDWIKEIDEDLTRFIFNVKRIELLEAFSGIGYERDKELYALHNQNEQLENRFNQIKESVLMISDLISKNANTGKSELLKLKEEIKSKRDRLEFLYEKSNRTISDVLECEKIESSISDYKKKQEAISNSLYELEACISNVEKFRNFIVAKGL